MTRSPLWLALPSRFAALSRTQARIVLSVLAALLLASLTVLGVPHPAPDASGAGGDRQTDVALYEGIVAAVTHGQDYYRAAADALRAGSYPLRPFLTFRLPGLAVVQAALPPAATLALLYALAAVTGFVWYRRLAEALPGLAARLFALFLLAAGMLAFVQPALIAFHEIWAGLLVALSLALRRPGKWVEAAAIALIAMLVRETAALYVVIMCALAFVEGQRREAIGWGAALGVFAVVLAAHAVAVQGVTGALDAASPGWTGMHGFGLFVRAMTLATGLQLLPAAAAALLVALTLFGWASWRNSLALRAAAIFCAYAVVISLFARLDTFYWGLLIAPAFLAGLAFVPDGLRDLAARALDRRRVRVQRIEQ
ncbi:hypothetical protein OK349_14830 [Sphingomonas sp. BT-65]|uniref:hypothetical protein n=1 Tax=Sphingomonas sp. BT-65 TaxID=2989821 RepID=UPI002236BCDC|nr:hypothetical protein [Sphingomonas sp. BT-65]MCW4462987.1 hypothetical protein [Sphingomonas sp. BT-65]